MSIANYTLPDYLKPISSAEQQSLDLRRQEQIGEQAARWSSMQTQQQESQMRQQEFLRQNLDRMQRRATMARMVGEAAANQASGMDPYEAKETAFLQAAPDLFKDSPEVYQAVTEKAYTGLQRRLGWKKYSTRLTELTAENAQLPPDEQRSFDEISQQALDENMGQLDPTGAATASILRATKAGQYSLRRTEMQVAGAEKRAKMAQEGASQRSDQIGTEYQRYKAALSANDKDLAEFHKGRLVKLSQATGMSLKVNPDGTVEMTQGPLGGDLTKATQSDLQKKLQASQGLVFNINSAISKMSPGTVGIPGILNENWEWIANTIEPGSIPSKATDARTTMRIATHAAIQDLKTDSQISAYERKQLDAIADFTKFNESDPTARAKAEQLRDLSSAKAIRTAKSLGQKPPDWALRSLNDELIVNELYKDGTISKDDAIAWGKTHIPQ